VTEEPPKTPLPTQKRSIKHKKLVIVASAVIVAVVVLFAPIIPTQYTVTKTRTRTLHYSSEVYGTYNVPKYVAVTNTDTVGGSFAVRMEWWETSIIRGQSVSELKDTYTQSLTISAKAAKNFNLPDDWLILGFWDSFKYSVTAPSTQETYRATETQYKSVFNLIEEALET
jgi:hypothetical protein